MTKGKIRRLTIDDQGITNDEFFYFVNRDSSLAIRYSPLFTSSSTVQINRRIVNVLHPKNLNWF
jgi:hypothetical protein